jgi:primosomal protein N' (replication factor Y) (superfamily II helicase)
VTEPARYARVVVDVRPVHLDRPFDYLVPDGVEVGLGQRVRVTFAGRRRNGWVVGTADRTDTDPKRIRALEQVQGEQTWFDESDLRWLEWAARRYGAPLADVLRHAFPARVAAVEAEARRWPDPSPHQPADRPPCPAQAWRPYAASALLKSASAVHEDGSGPAFWWRALVGDDWTAMLLDLVARTLAAGRTALVLVPDPASPLSEAALSFAAGDGADLRAQGSERDRFRAALRCRTGHARVAVGERSAVFAPLRDLGLIVVEDEANPAYKERRSPRHHAREIALARARMAGATCVLTGDLPSAHLWRLLEQDHVQRVTADRAIERDRAPRVDVADLSDPRPGRRRARFTDEAAHALSQTVRAGEHAVVVAARGGQGTALACRGCGTRRRCPVCDGSLRTARGGTPSPGDGAPPQDPPSPRWECAACGWDGPATACSECRDERTAPLAAGAGRLAQELSRSHPEADVVRMEGFDAPGPQRRPGLGVMTRGSVVDRPSWLGAEPAAIGVLPDADAMLNRPTLDAAEDALRLWFAVARWCHRLIVQTREPNHPAVQALVRWDPAGFWQREGERRAELRYPPAASLIRISAPADTADEVAGALRGALPADDDVLGPALDGEVLVKTDRLPRTLEALRPLHEDWDRSDRKVRIDVDPVTL